MSLIAYSSVLEYRGDMFVEKSFMSPSTKEVIDLLKDKGYLPATATLDPDIANTLLELDNEIIEIIDNVHNGVLSPHQATSFLSLDVRHDVSKLDISLHIRLRYLEDVGRMECQKVTAISGLATRDYPVSSNQNLPGLDDIAKTMQHKLHLSPFRREAERLMENLGHHSFDRIRVGNSQRTVIDAILKKIAEYEKMATGIRSMLFSVTGVYQWPHNPMHTKLTVEVNRKKGICQLKQIETSYHGTKKMYLPGRAQHLDLPYEMLGMLINKHQIERASSLMNRPDTAERHRSFQSPKR